MIGGPWNPRGSKENATPPIARLVSSLPLGFIPRIQVLTFPFSIGFMTFITGTEPKSLSPEGCVTQNFGLGEKKDPNDLSF